jgi:hypothetical protein
VLRCEIQQVDISHQVEGMFVESKEVSVHFFHGSVPATVDAIRLQVGRNGFVCAADFPLTGSRIIPGGGIIAQPPIRDAIH